MMTLSQLQSTLHNKVILADILMSAATMDQQGCRYASSPYVYERYDGIALKGQRQSYLELKYRKKDMAFFEKYPPFIEVDKYAALIEFERSFYVNFIEDNGKILMLSWDLSDENIIQGAPYYQNCPATSHFHNQNKKQKLVVNLRLEKAHIKDITSKVYNNLPAILMQVQK